MLDVRVVSPAALTQPLINVVLLIVVGAAGLHTQRVIWRSPSRPDESGADDDAT